MANFQLQDVQKVSYALTALDLDGNPAALAGGDSVAVSSSDSEMALVTPDTVPNPGSIASGMIVGGSKLGTVQVSAAVTHLDGTKGATGTVSIDVVSGPAASISIALGTPA